MSDQNKVKKSEAEKREELKRIIERLHAGESASRVKKDFDLLIKDVSAEEIASMEQALMKAGMPAEEIQRLCEVHVSVFESSLEKQGRPDKVSGHPVHTFMAENEAARASLSRLRSANRALLFPWSRGEEADAAMEAALLDFRKILIHYTRKENQLFPYLEAKGFDAPSKVMWGKHDEIRALFREADEAKAAGDSTRLRRTVKALTGKASRMFFMEERILFPAALNKLDEKDWIAIRRGENAIGYAWVGPGGAWDPDIAEAKLPPPPQASTPRAEPSGGVQPSRPEAETEKPLSEGQTPQSPQLPAPDEAPGAMRLGEGWLNAAQIDLMLKCLPVDLSFVDENDRVLYYTDGKERVFPRSPAVIGRDVHNCHPPKSVHIVKKILDAFRAKEKSEAEFWIEMGGKFLHIRYFPMYDAGGAYRGCLEMTQDVTGIRALQGQRRLLDWT